MDDIVMKKIAWLDESWKTAGSAGIFVIRLMETKTGLEKTVKVKASSTKEAKEKAFAKVGPGWQLTDLMEK